MLNHFDAAKIDDKWGEDEEADDWAGGNCRADHPYYKYCNSQWRARAHRQIEYDTYIILKDYKKLKNENIRLLDEQSKVQKQVARLINVKNRLESQVRKLKN